MPFDKKKAQKAIKFISQLRHTKGKWAGVKWSWIPWQIELIQEAFGRVKKDGTRQYRFIYVEVPKKSGKSELAAAVANKLLFADSEVGGEVYSAAGDRSQASIVFNLAVQMRTESKALKQRSKAVRSVKRLLVPKTNSFYCALSAETYTKHGINPSGIIIDELHAHPTRDLYDTLTDETDAARSQQMVFIITTAGIYDPNSIGWEIHNYATNVRDGIIEDPSFLPVIHAADEEEDWKDPKVWAKVNPSLGYIFDAEYVKKKFAKIELRPSLENNFRRFRLNQWVKQSVRWINMDSWDACNLHELTEERLRGRSCYSGLDLSSNTDVTALVHVFPPDDPEGIYDVLPEFFIPEDNMQMRSRRDGVPYDMWVRAGLITATPGNVVDYKFIIEAVKKAGLKYDLQELPYDRWGATKVAQDLDDEGVPIVPFGQGFASMSGPTKELETLVLQKRLNHGGNPVLRWMANNMVVKTDPAGNTKPDKSKSTEKIDGIVATIMALGRAVKGDGTFKSIYEDRGITVL